MNIPHSILDNADTCTLTNNICLTSPFFASNLSLPAIYTETSSIGATSPWEDFWEKAKKAQIVDDNGEIKEDIIKNYPMEELSPEEFQAIIRILTEPIKGKNEITFTLLDYFSYIIEESFNLDQVTITSINLIGGILPSVLKSYYIRNLNNLYRKQCQKLSIEYKQDLITEVVAADLDRLAPDTDSLITIDKDNLALPINLGTRFFAQMLKLDQNINQKDKVIRDTFYHAKKVLSDFSMVSFGPKEKKIDCNFIHQSKINRGLFLHHALRLNILPLIRDLKQNKCTHNLKLIPMHDYCGGWEAMLARVGKKIKLVRKNAPNDRAWSADISNKTTGYGFWDPTLERQLFQIMIAALTRSEITVLLKKKWEDHHDKEPLALIPLIINAVISLIENKFDNPRAIWDEAMCWYDAEIIELQKQNKLISNEKMSPFLISIKEVFADNLIPFEVFRDILQVYGCLMNASLQSSEPNLEPKALLTNSEAVWHEVTIWQKIDCKNYVIAIPLNLFEAIQTLLQLTSDQIQRLGKLISHISPKATFKRDFIPTNLITDKLANIILGCFDHSHAEMKRVGYDLLLIYTLSSPKQWILKVLIKHLPIALIAHKNRSRLLNNLENALRIFPETIQIHKITSPLIAFCEQHKTNPNLPLLELCIALASTNDTGIVHDAVLLHASIKKVSLQDRIHFIKVLLPNHSAEVAKLLLNLQKEKRLSDDDEIKIFDIIAEEIKKKPKNLRAHLSLSISDYANPLLQSKKHARQTCLKIAKAFIAQPEEAQKWMAQILHLVAKTDDPDALFFIPQTSNFPLISINLPPNPVIALETLCDLQEDELKVFFDLLRLVPHTVLDDMPIAKSKPEKTALIDCAKKCLKHTHPEIKYIGFELLMICAWSFKLPSKNAKVLPQIDPKLLRALMRNLPSILTSNPKMCDLILNRMKTILSSSSFATHADIYLDGLQSQLKVDPLKSTSEATLFRELYQVTCIALASTNKDAFCKMSEKFFININKFAPNLKDIDQIEIAFASISLFLPDHVLLALDALKRLEAENKNFKTLSNKSRHGIEKQKIYLQLINALIEQNNIPLAKEQLLKAIADKILVHSSPETGRLWLSLLNKVLTHFELKATIELWGSMQKQGKLDKTLSNQHVDFMINMIDLLYSTQNSSSDDIIKELQIVIKNLGSSTEQQSRLNLLVINDLKTNSDLGIKRLKLSYSILEKSDLSWFANAKIDYFSVTLHWLNAAVNIYELDDEVRKLLANLLKILFNGLSTHCIHDNIFNLSELLTGVLISLSAKNKTLSKDFKNQIILTSSKIVDLLQKSSKVDLLLGYLCALNSHNMLGRSSTALFNQSLWLADEILTNEKKNSEKLQNLQKLLKPFFQIDLGAIQLKESKKLIPIKLAKALLKHQLYTPAKEWIDITIKMQKSPLLSSIDLARIYSMWCHSYLHIQQPQYSFSLFTAMCNLPNRPSSFIKAQLCFDISKALLNENYAASAQLLLNHWPLLNQFIDKNELQEHLKNVIELVTSKERIPNGIALSCSLIALHYPQDTNFLLSQLAIIGNMIKLPADISNEEIQTTEFYKVIASTFFSRELGAINDEVEYSNTVDLRFHLIFKLLKSTERLHVLSGLALLNIFLEEALQNKIYPLKEISSWADMCNEILLHWFEKTPKNIIAKFSKTLTLLLDHQSKLLDSLSSSKSFEYGKNLELDRLKNCIYSAPETIESSIDRYNMILYKYVEDKEPLDLEWLDIGISFIVDNICSEFLNSGNATWLLTMHNKVMKIFERQSFEGLLLYLQCTVQFYLPLDLEDTQKRAVCMYLIGSCLEYLTEPKNLDAQKNISKIVDSVGAFLYSRPFPLQVFSIELPQNIEIKKLVKNEGSFNESKAAIPSESPPLLLTAEYFNKCFANIVTNLEKWGYDETFPIAALSNQLLVHNSMAPLENSHDSDDLATILSDTSFAADLLLNPQVAIKKLENASSIQNLKVFKNVTVKDQITAVLQVLKKLTEQNVPQSSVKAVTIFQNIPTNYWVQFSEDFYKTFTTLIEDENLYPDHMENIIKVTLDFADSLKDSGPIKYSTQLIYLQVKKLQSADMFGGIPLLSHFSIPPNYNAALMFISDCLKLDLIDKASNEFLQISVLYLELLLKIQFEKRNKILYTFFSNALSNPSSSVSDVNWKKNKKTFLNIIEKHISEILSLDNAKLANNLKIYFLLKERGYFTGKESRWTDIWPYFSTQFPVKESKNFIEDLRRLISCRLHVVDGFSNITKSDKRNKIKLQKMNNEFITAHINDLIVNDQSELGQNIIITNYFINDGYYKERESELLTILHMLADLCISLHEKNNVIPCIAEESFNELIKLLYNAPLDPTGKIQSQLQKLLKISLRLWIKGKGRIKREKTGEI